jgi:DNA-binding transcriptional MerR regulator
MAYYDEDFVRRVQLVKVLQTKTHLPLRAIRETLNGMPGAADVDPERLAELTRTIADTVRMASERDTPRAELIESTDVTPADLDGLTRTGLLEPIRRNGQVLYSPLDVRIALAFARIRQAGAIAGRNVGPVVRAYKTHLNEIARVEALQALRPLRSIARSDLEDYTRRTTEATDELIAALHRKALVRALSELMNSQER